MAGNQCITRGPRFHLPGTYEIHPSQSLKPAPNSLTSHTHNKGITIRTYQQVISRDIKYGLQIPQIPTPRNMF